MSLTSDEPMFETKSEPLLSRGQFLGRLARAFGVTLLIVAVSLAIGMAGYHFLADLPWIDALLNSAMILTGMGPVDTLKTPAAKLFASFYALYSGIAFLSMTAVLLAPIIHRAMHKFHLDAEEEEQEKPAGRQA
jgi:ABC-type glycerol-3-phosphate transport system permease component